MKVWFVGRKVGVFLFAALIIFFAILIMSRFSDSKAVSVANAAKRDLPIYYVEKDENDKKISISFDAAWDNSDSEHIKEILGERNIKTTFFVVGTWVDNYPETVKSLSDAGHEIMNHSATHPHMTQISSQKMAEELNTCADKIENITGKRPNLFRPPYGDYNDEVVKTARECGYYTIQWNIDSLDWKDLSADEIYKRVVPKVKPGSIILFHNAAKHTPEALPKLLDDLIAQGYEIVPISELIIKDNYQIDPNGMQFSSESSQ